MFVPVIATLRARSTCWYKAFNCAVPNERPFSLRGSVSVSVMHRVLPRLAHTHAVFFIAYWQVAMKPFTVDN